MVSKASPLGVFALFTLLSHTVSAAVSHATATEITYSPKTTPVAGIAQLDPFVPLSLHALVHVANLSFSEDELLRNDEILRRTTTDLWGRDNSPRDHLDASLEQRDLALASRLKIQVSETCQDETSNDLIISSLFYYGGVGTTVFLCPNTVINITSPMYVVAVEPGSLGQKRLTSFAPNSWFTSANQTLATLGLPTGDSRATLFINARNQSCAIVGARDFAHRIAVRNIQIDGGRQRFGLLAGAVALLEMGGNTFGQLVDHVHAFEPRGWSVLHGIEGWENYCWGMVITNNQIGPSGHAPSGVSQFRRRDNMGNYTGGQWADGISVACRQSLIQNNVVTDATDGAIVLFGSPGTQVIGNLIQSRERQLMGGVDWGPYAGNYSGVVVANNTIWARSNFIKIGIPVGGTVWGTDNRTSARGGGGLIINNTFLSGPTGYFAYAIGIAGHENGTFVGNTAKRANFGSVTSSACFEWLFHLPDPQAFIRDPHTTPGGTYQDGFWSLSTLALLICRGPGAILTRGSPY